MRLKSKLAISLFFTRVPRNQWNFARFLGLNFALKICEKTYEIDGAVLGAKMRCKCSKIASKSMPNPYENAQENPCQTKSEKWWMAKRAATHRAGPTPSRGNPKSPSIQQSMWLVLLHWLSARRPNHKKGNSMCRIRTGNVRIDGDQKMPKVRPRIAKLYSKWRPTDS